MEINEDNYWAWMVIGLWIIATVLSILFRKKNVGEPYREAWHWVKFIEKIK